MIFYQQGPCHLQHGQAFQQVFLTAFGSPSSSHTAVSWDDSISCSAQSITTRLLHVWPILCPLISGIFTYCWPSQNKTSGRISFPQASVSMSLMAFAASQKITSNFPQVSFSTSNQRPALCLCSTTQRPAAVCSQWTWLIHHFCNMRSLEIQF